MAQWWKRWWNRMFSKQDEETQDKHSHIQPGRFPSTQRENDAKIIHQYPKNGNFRFPLIPDDEVTESIERKIPTRRKPRAEVEKFTGRDFKASDVPSPVYGFGERTINEVVNSRVEQTVLEHEDEKHDLAQAEEGEGNEVQQEEQIEEVHSPELEQTPLEHEQAHSPTTRQEKMESEQTEEQPKQVQVRPNLVAYPSEQKKIRIQQETEKPKSVLMFTADRNRNYFYPKLDLLDAPIQKQEDDSLWLEEQKNLLNETLTNFNVKATVTKVVKGPTVTRFEVQPRPGVKVSRITNLSDDIKLSLAAKEIRIEAPIPGKNAIGIEVPNRSSQPVALREIVESEQFQAEASPLAAALGVDIAGKPVVTDLQKMPHGLIAGATGSGKSVCINAILMSILYKADPDDVKLMLIDPKVVELAPYNELPHLVTPVITDVKEATHALKWAVEEMEKRYKQFASTKVRDIERYNQNSVEKMPYIVIIIDELADLMMVSPQEVEDAICRLAQKARACGIHLLVATQRPSVDVITGLIKANIPTRIAFSVSSQVDSRTILDAGGAEKLLGRGDMLFLENGASKPVRLQGNFVSDDEIDRITQYIKRQRKPNYLIEMEELSHYSIEEFEDELFFDACEFTFEQGAASSSSLQRRFRIGYNRAARLIDMMEDNGLVSQANGSKPRKLLMTKQEFKEKMGNEI